MEFRDEIINAYKEIMFTNKNLLILAKKHSRLESKQKKANAIFFALGLAGIAYVTITEIRHEDQCDTIKRLSKEIAELKRQKGE